MTAVEWLVKTLKEDGQHVPKIYETIAEGLEKQQKGYSEEDMREAFIEGYKQRAEKSNLIFDNASRMYAIHLFKQFKKK